MDVSAALVVRADAGASVGTGHVMRCLALAAAWQKLTDAAARVCFVSATPLPAGLEARLRSLGFDACTAPDAGDDAGFTLEVARRLGATWIVVDGYGFDGAYERRLSSAGFRVAALDDYGHTRHAAHLVVNPNLGADPARYDPLEPGSTVLAGPEYALLRPEFWPYRGKVRPARAPLRKVLVTMGGSDVARVTPRVIEGLAPLGLDVRVVVGGADRGADETAALANSRGVAVVRNAPDMASEMAWADLAVTAAGVTLQELLFMGVPSLAVVVADNQRPGAVAAEKEGLVRLLGWHESVTAEALRAGVGALVSDPQEAAALSRRAQNAIDGAGAERVARAMV